MHDDMTAILRSYSDEIHAKGKKENNPIYQQRRKEREGQEKPTVSDADKKQDQKQAALAEQLSDEVLLRELARRKANQYRLVGAMKSTTASQQQNQEEDVVCTRDGANGTIRCYELME